jgi:hypothetical protein
MGTALCEAEKTGTMVKSLTFFWVASKNMRDIPS